MFDYTIHEVTSRYPLRKGFYISFSPLPPEEWEYIQIFNWDVYVSTKDVQGPFKGKKMAEHVASQMRTWKIAMVLFAKFGDMRPEEMIKLSETDMGKDYLRTKFPDKDIDAMCLDLWEEVWDLFDQELRRKKREGEQS